MNIKQDFPELPDSLKDSPLLSDDLAPVPPSGRTWGTLHLAALWVGMAVCIPTYLLASYMIRDGVSWWMALIIIGFANLIITLPMVLNGHGGVKYGVPFPVLGRSAFGTAGVHIPAVVRGIVACGWFGVQTWIGGLAIYSMFNALFGFEGSVGLSVGKFVGFGVFWLINVAFIWKGTDSIKWLEAFAAPILVIMGLVLIGWGAKNADGFGIVLAQSSQLQSQTATISKIDNQQTLTLSPLKDKNGELKATHFALLKEGSEVPSWEGITTTSDSLAKSSWTKIEGADYNPSLLNPEIAWGKVMEGEETAEVVFSNSNEKGIISSAVTILPVSNSGQKEKGKSFWSYLFWLTAMVGFWATMSISIADITRFAASQSSQVKGQFLGLPTTMLLYSFVGIFVTCAAIINFGDILVAEDAPWDPVALLDKFKSPFVVVIAQLFMIIATLSTNIAANVIAPANAFSNLLPKKISFRTGGMITALIGIIICPWWLMDQIAGILIFVSGLLGPVLGILIADYFFFRKTELNIVALFDPEGEYKYSGGVNMVAVVALGVGVFVAIIGYWIPVLEPLYKMSWFSGFFTSLIIYYVLMKKKGQS